MGALTLGRGTEEGVDVGPLVDEKSRDKVSALVDDAVAKGARVLVGGSAPEGAGWFYQPTVLADVPDDADLAREEIFGPVAPVIDLPHRRRGDPPGQRHRVRPRRLPLHQGPLAGASRCSEALEFGMVGVNQGIVSNPAAPFGGVKASGVGREGGFEGIDEYLETKYVGIAL